MILNVEIFVQKKTTKSHVFFFYFSEKSALQKKELNREPPSTYYSGGVSCGSASPAPSYPEDPGKPGVEDDLLATEV